MDIVFVKMTQSLRIGLTQVHILPPFRVGILITIHFGIRNTVPIVGNCRVRIFGTIQHTLVVDRGCCIEATATVLVVRNITYILSFLVLAVGRRIIGRIIGRIIVAIIVTVPIRVWFTSINVFPPFRIDFIIAAVQIGDTIPSGSHCSIGIFGTIDATLVCYYSCCIQTSAAIVGTSNSRADLFTLSTATNHHHEEWQHHHRHHHHDSITKKSDHFVHMLVFFSHCIDSDIVTALLGNSLARTNVAI
mmetsp:Transcript_3060/g.3439  ORF Transcript_3060/g.3439 Transcript_3060/m.3439 type:complete len:247 (-) Transcript_3060:70-810(-)